jgi:DNA-directed RNA polymerase subunit M/transcription elongation factor TFIIS
MIDTDTRKKILHKILNIIKEKEYAKKIESSIYNFSKDYADTNNSPFLLDSIYKSKADELICLLSGPNFKYIIKALHNNTIKPLDIAYLKPSELNIDQYSDIIKKKQVNNDPKGTNAFECKKCKKRKCSVIEKQVASADEPATLFITCLECGHVFMN